MSIIESRSPADSDTTSGVSSLFVRTLLLVGSGMRGLYTLAVLALVVLLFF
ncbi:hypothetical protein [Halorussus halophilus]|uniref:hypothetical protein n=1 Tax=Halorussus halophilus TaxID=2650975 RepID=UPI0017880AD6|nr:hypothetical protein [Halorussus halophilus]